jgi:sulfur-oxidizing protein SoxB
MELTGEAIKNRLEDIADNVFNPDPYYQEGGDMVRVAGLSFLCQPAASMGQRIESLHFKGEPLMPNRRYRVANWASMNEGPQWGSMGDCLSDYLKRYSPV